MSAAHMQHLDPSRRSAESGEFETALRRKIVGQDEAVGALVDIYQVFRAGLHSPGRPVGNLLFLGPTGSGKTRIVEAMGEILFGDPRAVIKVDCAEFQHSHEIAKLIGSPPGYLGHRETHPLITQETLSLYHTENLKLSLLLFDEIEKASDALWQLLLGILDKATLTLGDNRRVDLSQTLIFMTSNLGGSDISTLMTGGLGFVQPSDKPSDAMDTKVERTATEAAKRKFSPEFMNRIDKVVVFHPLRPEQLEKVLDIELDLVQRRVLDTARGQFVFRLTRAAREFLLREGTDIKYGARHLKRAIERHVVYPLANLLSTGQIMVGDILSIDWDSATQQLSFARTGESTLVTLAPPAPLFATQAISAWGGRSIEIPAQANAREAQAPASSAPPAPAPVAAKRRHDTQR
ncbi:MAG: AAA family ATPase [Acidobacteria bacterium]|nr:AAA family ATPase [Acidobacteriota bacterium]MCL5288967.1 AAA family ATPase [Acidobacteriota bacterium]